MSSEPLLLRLIEGELATIPRIRFLDDYIHLEAELARMRSNSHTKLVLQRLAMELAVLLRLQEYDEALGLPPSIMPSASNRTEAYQFGVGKGDE